MNIYRHHTLLHNFFFLVVLLFFSPLILFIFLSDSVMVFLKSRTKHLLHCLLLITVILVFELWTGGIKLSEKTQQSFQFNPWHRYGYIWCSVLYLLRILTFLPFPQVLFNFVGLTFYNAFPDKVQLKGSPILAPFICIRVVTRGDYPHWYAIMLHGI